MRVKQRVAGRSNHFEYVEVPDPIEDEFAEHCPCAGKKQARATTTTATTTLRPVSRLAAVTTFFNPAGYRNIRRNYDLFAAAWSAQGVPLFTAELVFGAQPFTIPGAFLQVRGDSRHLMWQKERLLNLLVERLPPEYDAVAWLDADTIHLSKDVIPLTMEALQSSPAVQMWTWAHKTGRAGNVAGKFPAVAARIGPAKDHGSPGYNWAGHRSLFPVYDAHVCGSGDFLLWCAWAGWWPPYFGRKMNAEWLAAWREYADRVGPAMVGKVRAVPGDVVHLYHGQSKHRNYFERWRYLAQDSYDPNRDIEIDPDNGLYRWCSDKPRMHQNVAGYFKERREDE